MDMAGPAPQLGYLSVDQLDLSCHLCCTVRWAVFSLSYLLDGNKKENSPVHLPDLLFLSSVIMIWECNGPSIIWVVNWRLLWHATLTAGISHHAWPSYFNFLLLWLNGWWVIGASAPFTWFCLIFYYLILNWGAVARSPRLEAGLAQSQLQPPGFMPDSSHHARPGQKHFFTFHNVSDGNTGTSVPGFSTDFFSNLILSLCHWSGVQWPQWLMSLKSQPHPGSKQKTAATMLQHCVVIFSVSHLLSKMAGVPLPISSSSAILCLSSIQCHPPGSAQPGVPTASGLQPDLATQAHCALCHISILLFPAITLSKC